MQAVGTNDDIDGLPAIPQRLICDAPAPLERIAHFGIVRDDRPRFLDRTIVIFIKGRIEKAARLLRHSPPFGD